MPKQKKEELEDIVLDPIEEKVKEPAPVEEPVEEPETVNEDLGEEITEPDAPIDEFEEPIEEPEEDEQGEEAEFDEDAGEEETDEDAPEEDAPPFLGLMLSGAKNAPVSEDPDPQSRIEALLWHIINGTTTDAVPQSRNEAILKAIANGGTYTEEAQSRIEALLISILNHEESDITPISRNEAILKAIANNTEYNEEPQSRNEELLIKWLEAISIVIGTASGAVASFNTSLTEPLVKCECEFSASQASGTPTPSNPISIDGVDKVNVTDCGINHWDEEWEGGTYSTADGRTSPSENAIRSKNRISIKPSSTFAFFNSTANAQIRLYYYDISGTFLSWEAKTAVNNVVTFTTPANACYMNFAVGDSVTPVTTNNQNLSINYPSTDTAYHAYAGGTTAIVNLGGTYYGGKVDAVTGKITNEIDKKKLSDFTWNKNVPNTDGDGRIWYHSFLNDETYNGYEGALCDAFEYQNSPNWANLHKYNYYSINQYFIICVEDDYATSNDMLAVYGDVEFTVKLRTPETVYASNTAEIPTLSGANNCFCDTGDVEVEYKKRRND